MREVSLAAFTQKQHYQGQLIQRAPDLRCCPVPNALPCQVPAAQAVLPLTGENVTQGHILSWFCWVKLKREKGTCVLVS